MYKKIIIILASLLIPIMAIGASIPSTLNNYIFGDSGTITRLDQWSSTSSPATAITQRVMNTAVRLTGLTGCIEASSNGTLSSSTGLPCGSGSGGGLGWASTTIPNSDSIFSTALSNVGIGTTSPFGKLSVTNSDTSPSFLVEDTASPDSSPFVINAAGDVGIGTLTPLGSNGNLTISGTGANGATNFGTIHLRNPRNNTQDYWGGIYFNGNATVGAAIEGRSVTSAAANGSLLFYTTKATSLQNSMTLNDTSLTLGLQNGTISRNFVIYNQNSGGEAVVFSGGNPATPVNTNSSFVFTSYGGGATDRAKIVAEAPISSNTSGNLNFYTSDGTTNLSRFIILRNGLIGIATSTPNNMLDIYSVTKPAIGFSGASGSTYKWTIGEDVSNGGRFAIASSTALGTLDRFVIDGMGDVGIGTTSPSSLLQTFSTGTSTISVDSNSTTKGGCIEMKDSDGVGYTYIYANDGVLTASTQSCK